MALFSIPMTWTDGSTPGASDLNREIRDNITALGKPPMVDVRRTTDQTGLSTSSDTLITWTGVGFLDNLGMWSISAPSQLTVQPGWAGYYKAHAVVEFSGGSGTTVATQYAFFRQNGSINRQVTYVSTVGGAGKFSVNITRNFLLGVGDYLEVVAHANSTIGATTADAFNTIFEMEFIGFN